VYLKAYEHQKTHYWNLLLLIYVPRQHMFIMRMFYGISERYIAFVLVTFEIRTAIYC